MYTIEELKAAQKLVQDYQTYGFTGKWLMSRKHKKALALLELVRVEDALRDSRKKDAVARSEYNRYLDMQASRSASTRQQKQVKSSNDEYYQREQRNQDDGSTLANVMLATSVFSTYDSCSISSSSNDSCGSDSSSDSSSSCSSD